MADQQTLAIVITAENAQAVASLNQLSNDLKKFEKGLKNAFDSSEVLKFSKSIEDTKRKMEVLNASLSPITNGTKGLAAGGNQAAQALTNVGRVAQDLPFGFMGIQNNLNPLLESFQRLKVETGSTKGALTALGSSLIGAGGIGLALSVVSSAILLYQNGMAGFNKKNEEAKAKVDALKDSLEKEHETAARDIAIMNTYVAAAKNASLSTEQRGIAVDALTSKYPAYFKGLTTENALTKDLTQTTDLLTDAIYKRAAARALEGDIATKATEIFRMEQKREADIAQARVELSEQMKKADRIGGGGIGGASVGTETVARQKLNNLLNDEKSFQQKILAIKQGITKEQEKVNKLYAETINLDQKAVKEKPAKIEKEKAVKAATQPKYDYKKQLEERLSDERKFFNDSYDIWKRNEDEKERELLRGRREREQAEQFEITIARDSGKVMFDQKEAENKQRLLGIEQSRLDVIANLNNKFKEQRELAETIGGAFQGLFQNIANGANPFETLSNAVKQLVVDLAAAAAKMFLIKAIMTAINPAAGAAKGAGGILGSLIGGITPFATGGIVSRPTLGMVGEAGTEAILPLDRFQGMLAQSFQMGSVSGNGGGTQTVVLDTVIRGNDLWLTQRRTDFNRGLKTGG